MYHTKKSRTAGKACNGNAAKLREEVVRQQKEWAGNKLNKTGNVRIT